MPYNIEEPELVCYVHNLKTISSHHRCTITLTWDTNEFHKIKKRSTQLNFIKLKRDASFKAKIHSIGE